MRNTFENPRAPFLGRSPVPGPQTPPGQSFGRFYYGGTPRMNTMPRANYGRQASMPTGYEYGAGLSGGSGYETWGQGQTNTGYPPDNIFSAGGWESVTPRPGGNGLSAAQNQGIMNNWRPGASTTAPRPQTPPGASGGSVAPRPGGNGLSGAQNQEIMNNLPAPVAPPPMTWQGPSGMPEGFTGGGGGRAITPWTNSVTGETWNAPSTGYKPPSSDWQLTGGQKFTGGLPGKLEGGDLRSHPNPAFEGIDMSGFKPPGVGSMDSRHYYINGVEQVGGSTHIAALQSYLDSIGQGDAFSLNRPDSFSQPINPGRGVPRKGGLEIPEQERDEGGNPVGWVDDWLSFYGPGNPERPPSNLQPPGLQNGGGGNIPINGGLPGRGGVGLYGGEQYAGLDMSGFNPRPQQTADSRAYTLNGKTYFGSSSWASQLQDYLNSTGQGDAFSFGLQSGFNTPGGYNRQATSSPSLTQRKF